MADITAIILTGNEEKNIGECIDSMKSIVKKIVVVDSGSKDRTVEIAKEKGAVVLIHPMERFFYAKQFMYGMENGDIQTKWVLRMDADERLTESSAKELDALCNANEDTDVNGIVLRFEVTFLGKKLRHGGIYPFRKLLCFKYGKGNIEDRSMDEHIVLSEGRSVEMKNDSEHHDYKDLAFWIDKHNKYSDREMLDYLEYRNSEIDTEGLGTVAKIRRVVKFKIYYKLPAGMRAKLYYWYRYYIKLGFLDGKEGKMFAFFQAYWYRYLVDAKIYEHEKNLK